jgi:two-component system chemotaxis response regulator CheY
VTRRVLDVGQCQADHGAIRGLLEVHFGAEVVQAHGLDDTLAHLRAGRFDLLLINRKLDADSSDGMDVLRAIKADPRFSDQPVMLVTNYAQHQQAALAAGAVPGFGKAQLDAAETRAALARVLEGA